MRATRPRGCEDKLTQNFSWYEFDCHCGKCPMTTVDTALAKQLQTLRDLTGRRVTVISGFRCANHQKFLRDTLHLETSKGISTHELGQAADVLVADLSGSEIEPFARKAGFTSVGVAIRWVHVDTRKGERRWVYAGTLQK